MLIKTIERSLDTSMDADRTLCLLNLYLHLKQEKNQNIIKDEFNKVIKIILRVINND